MNENVCRLCLQTITENVQPVESCFKDILKLNLNISEAAVKCLECTNNLEVFLKFKSACDYMTEKTLSTGLKDDIGVDPKNIEITNNLLSLVESKRETRCCFCTKFSKREGLTSINEGKEHKFLVSVLKEHIPKLNLSITDELLTCETCLDGLQSVSSFVLKCMDVEQKINKYTESKGTGDKGQIELKDVQQFMFNPTVKSENKSEDVNDLSRGKYDRFQENHTVRSQEEIKCETKLENPELIIKTEDINVKSEHNDGERFQKSHSLTKIDNGSSDISASKPPRCINQHDVTYKNSEKIAAYGGEANEAKQQCYFQQNKLTHNITSELPIFKCDLCTYKSESKNDLYRHKSFHENASETAMFKCEVCSYESKHSRGLKQHRLTHHKSTSEIIMFKCEICAFETKRKTGLKRHMLTHEEISMFQCLLCSYEAKQKYIMDRHMLVHKSSSSVTMFKCEMCPYETRRKFSLKQHSLTHKCFTEVPTFKCELCQFETKYKWVLMRHKSTHKSTMRANELV